MVPEVQSAEHGDAIDYVFQQIQDSDFPSAVTRNQPLHPLSNWKIGGPADLLVDACSEEQIARTILAAREANLPLVVIGDGTNLLFDDSGVRGIVLKIGRRFSGFRIHANRITAQAGVWVPRLARASACNGLSGIEHTIGIPGTIGGLVWMNGGSLRKGIGDHVETVSVINNQGELCVLPRDECGFSYRASHFQTMDAIICGVALRLESGCVREIKSAMLDILRARSRKFPRKMPNCGSVFMSTGTLYDKYGPPGKIIEDLGFKGTRIGDAEVSPVHANFLVNRGRASSAEMLELIRRIRARIHQHCGIWIHCEVRYVAPCGSIGPAHTALTEQGT